MSYAGGDSPTGWPERRRPTSEAGGERPATGRSIQPCRASSSNRWACLGFNRSDLNFPNRRMRTRMSGGVGGVQPGFSGCLLSRFASLPDRPLLHPSATFPNPEILRSCEGAGDGAACISGGLGGDTDLAALRNDCDPLRIPDSLLSSTALFGLDSGRYSRSRRTLRLLGQRYRPLCIQ